MSFLKKFLTILVCGFLFACSSTDKYVERSDTEIYDKGMKYMRETAWVAAADEFLEIERQHPYSELAPKGLYLAGFAYYSEKDYLQAVIVLDRFLKLYPGHDQVPYVLYLKSECYFAQVSDIKREQKYTADAIKTMEELVRRYPDTPYAKAVKNRIIVLKNFLIAKEMEKAKELTKQQNFVAALRRYQGIIGSYPESYMTPEALFRKIEIYLTIGMDKQALEVGSILGANYPSSKWYKKAYKLLKNNTNYFKNKK